MVALETLFFLVVFAIGSYLAYKAWGEWINTHPALVASIFIAILAIVFVLSALLNGFSFSGAGLHPPPPPIATDTPSE